MNRTLWFLAGATTGVYAVVKARRAAEAVTPEGLRDRLSALSLGAHLVGEEVREEMAVREGELRRRIGLADGADGPHTGRDAAPAIDERPRLELTRKGND